MTFVLVGVGLVLLLLCLVILVVVLKRRKKQVPPRNDIIFENVREEAEDMGTDEYGRVSSYFFLPLIILIIPNVWMHLQLQDKRISYAR